MFTIDTVYFFIGESQRRHFVTRLDYSLDSPSPAETAALTVVTRLQAEGFEAYFVGGCVRDRLLGKDPKDVDVATNALPDEVMGLFPDSLAVGASFGVVLVKTDSDAIEVATFREDFEYTDGRRPDRVNFCTSDRDAARRDFTINALFFDPVKGEIIDYTDGLADLNRGLIRAIGEAERRFREDYLRMLRAVRFASRLGFEIEPETAAAIRRNATNVAEIAAERVFVELNGILTGPRPSLGLQLLHDLGLLQELLPEISALRGVEQPKKYHPEGDVWVHTMLMLDKLSVRDSATAWSVLLHDVGKPPTFSIDENGIERFQRHSHVGADMAEDILTRLKCSKRFIETVKASVYNHMSFAHLQDMRASTLRRLMARESLPIELELHRVDCASSHRISENYVFLLDKIREFADQPILPDPFVSGRDVMELGVSEGPEIGRLLHEIRERQLNDEITSREEALAWLNTAVDHE